MRCNRVPSTTIMAKLMALTTGDRAKAMAASHDQMMALCEENTPENLSEAHNIAHMLLERAELPLAFRTRAHMVLSDGKTD